MKFKYFLVPILSLIACGGLQVQNAETTPSATPGYGQPHHGRNHHAWIWKKLNLTDDQRTRIRSIKESLKGQTRPALAAVLTAKMKLHQDINANSDKGLIAADTSALATAESQFASVRAMELSQIKGVLTQAQQTTLTDFQNKRQARMQERINKLSQPSS